MLIQLWPPCLLVKGEDRVGINNLVLPATS